MKLTNNKKADLINELLSCLNKEKEIQKIVIFGSFSRSADPGDIDVVIFQNSKQSYLPLALKYRKKTRSISQKIPLDIIPVTSSVKGGDFIFDINEGEVIYER